MSFLDGADLKALVIEDNQHFRLLINTVLHTLGVTRVEEARDGVDALRRLRTFAADFVIADWKMEPMDGISFAHKIRRSQESPNPFLPIIMVSGYSESALVTEAKNAGINEFLPKPISARGLVARIISVIRNPRPFVRSEEYFGPDRRRSQQPFPETDRRRMPPEMIFAPIRG